MENDKLNNYFGSIPPFFLPKVVQLETIILKRGKNEKSSN
jgi:hypothetical protein